MLRRRTNATPDSIDQEIPNELLRLVTGGSSGFYHQLSEDTRQRIHANPQTVDEAKQHVLDLNRDLALMEDDHNFERRQGQNRTEIVTNATDAVNHAVKIAVPPGIDRSLDHTSEAVKSVAKLYESFNERQRLEEEERVREARKDVRELIEDIEKFQEEEQSTDIGDGRGGSTGADGSSRFTPAAPPAPPVDYSQASREADSNRPRKGVVNIIDYPPPPDASHHSHDGSNHHYSG